MKKKNQNWLKFHNAKTTAAASEKLTTKNHFAKECHQKSEKIGGLTYLEKEKDKKEKITLVEINLSKLVIELQKLLPK